MILQITGINTHTAGTLLCEHRGGEYFVIFCIYKQRLMAWGSAAPSGRSDNYSSHLRSARWSVSSFVLLGSVGAWQPEGREFCHDNKQTTWFLEVPLWNTIKMFLLPGLRLLQVSNQALHAKIQFHQGSIVLVSPCLIIVWQGLAEIFRIMYGTHISYVIYIIV